MTAIRTIVALVILVTFTAACREHQPLNEIGDGLPNAVISTS
jgi:hypothetical protein